MIKFRPLTLKLIALPFAGILLAGCGTTSSSGGSDVSRVRLYSSANALAADSSLVVVGVVSKQRVAADITPDLDFTISTINVQKVVKKNGKAQAGSTVEVRQDGSSGQSPSTTLLKPGTPYLLFLTDSGLDGALASQFYVTGANAGLYAADSTAARVSNWGATPFKQLDKESGEKLPATISPDSLAGDPAPSNS